MSYLRDALTLLEYGQYLPRQHIHRWEDLCYIVRVASNNERLYPQVGKRLDLLHNGSWLGTFFYEAAFVKPRPLIFF